jgi:5-methylcytosine-specific restriction protein B
MNTFTWIPFYKEFAKSLLQFRHDRRPLLDFIYAHRSEMKADYLHDEGGYDDLLTDIDPFTVFGIFNRGTTNENRQKCINLFKQEYGISAQETDNFNGIPVLNNQKSHFFAFRNRRSKDDIENLWALFETVVNGDDCEEAYNRVIRQYIIRVNITMGLFWIKPEIYLSLDSRNKAYLKKHYGITLPDKAPEYSEYMALISSIREKLPNGGRDMYALCNLSRDAWNDVAPVQTEENNTIGDYYSHLVNLLRQRKSLVLYGAPGTGKTYDIPELAVRLCSPDFRHTNDRGLLMEEYRALKQQKRIMFTTFHQSFDYEDWMEGLRPQLTETHQLQYDIEPGIFKTLCQEAEKPITKNSDIDIDPNAVIWKVSLYRTGDNEIRTDCMENNRIRIGWDNYGPTIDDNTDWNEYNGSGWSILNAFINQMKVGDIVVSCYTNRTTDAIGVVTGEYEWDDSLDEFKRTRKVKWLLKGIEEDIVDINGGKVMTLSTIYRLNNMSLESVMSILEKHKANFAFEANSLPYVMVIDEMNRGNISRIFGELITLIEPDKRRGMPNEESVKLPYSKTQFSVPDNVYLLATMNTADRSLDTLDYAVRRRFAFAARRPMELAVEGFDTELFQMVSKLFVSNYEVYAESGWDSSFVLQPATTLAEEFRPDDVWIGHSYFLMQDANGRDITSNRLRYEILPMLQEYIRDGVLKDTPEVHRVIEQLLDIIKE